MVIVKEPPPSPPRAGDDRRFLLSEIARIFGIPERLIGNPIVSTFATNLQILIAQRRTQKREDRMMAKQPTLPGMKRTPGRGEWNICGFHPDGPHRWEGTDRPCPWCEIEKLKTRIGTLKTEAGNPSNPIATTPAREAGQAEGRKRAIDGAERAAKSADRSDPEWRGKAFNIIRELALRSEFITSDDAHELANLYDLADPPEPRAWSGPWTKARRRGVVEDSGRRIKSTRPNVHHAEIPVYRSLIWKGRPR